MAAAREVESPREVARQKIARVKAAVNLQPHDRVPIVGTGSFWTVRFAGKYSMQDAFYSVDALAESCTRAFSEWPGWDAYGAQLHAYGPLLDALGSRRYNVPGRDLPPDVEFQHPDLTLMEAAEYPALIRDPVRFLVETISPRLCSNLNPQDMYSYTKAVGKAALYVAEMRAKGRHYASLWMDQYGIPPIYHGHAVQVPTDLIADKLRGFEQGLLDIREHPEELAAACEAVFPLILHTTLASVPAAGDFPLLFNPQHVSPFISPRAYERLYWPTFKKLMDELVQRGYQVWVFFEHDQTHHLEKLQELPPGRIVAHLEDTDLVEAKRKLGGKLCIAGGMEGRLLARGSVEEVRERTRAVLKLFADEPGFIMACGTSIPANSRPENIHAWLQTVAECGRLSDLLPRSPAPATSPPAAGKPDGRLPYTPWAAVREAFGPVQGDEQVIADRWEELEQAALPLLSFLFR